VIAMLTGTLASAAEGAVIVDVGGVGYLVFVSAQTLRRLPAEGELVRLLVETHVREDHIHLYGFAEDDEREWFRRLMTVQGVGARMALSVLGVLSPRDLVQAIAAQDRAALTRADGVGAKLATRILSELKDKAGSIALEATLQGAPRLAADGAMADAISALVNLGYQRSEAFGAVAHASRQLGADAPVEALIRSGLRELGA